MSMKDNDFCKLTKKEKLALPVSIKIGDEITVSRVLFIPIRRKMSGYHMAAVFVCDTDGVWHRGWDYDCFSFTIWKPRKSETVRGDFEYGGIVFFIENEKHPCVYRYGGGFDIGSVNDIEK